MEDIRTGSGLKPGDLIAARDNGPIIVIRDNFNGRVPFILKPDTPQTEIEKFQQEAKREASVSQRRQRGLQKQRRLRRNLDN